MKYARLLIVSLIAMMLAGEVDAQVSVRRTSKSTSTEQSGGKKDTKKDNKKGNKPEANSGAKLESPKNAAARPTLDKGKGVAGKPSLGKGGDAAPLKRPGVGKKQQPNQGLFRVDGKTLRQQAFDDYQKDNAEETPWQHIVYRELDLTKDENASLYFPIEPMNGLTNLFRVIIDAFSKGELNAYEYLDGREVFTEKFLVKPQDIFDKFSIYYKVKPATVRGGKDTYEVDESDVPSSEVLSYFVKERWEFDQKHSKYQARILCICPVLHQAGDFSADAVKYPMFWINYEDLRPFLRDHLVVSQGMNTAARYTMEEYFTLGQYKGDIYKEQNLRGLSLKQQVGDNPDSLKMAQDKLDNDLRAFEDSIWVKDPEPEPVVDKKAQREAKMAEKINAKAAKGSENTAVDPSAKKNRRTKEPVDMEAAAEEKEAKASTRRSVRR